MNKPKLGRMLCLGLALAWSALGRPAAAQVSEVPLDGRVGAGMALSAASMPAALGGGASVLSQDGLAQASSLPGIAPAAGPALAGPAQVIIIRHGEKPETGSDLSPRGYQRAQALVGFFQNNPAVTQHGPPAAIYAEKPKPDGSQVRPLETVQPLAASLGLQVDTDYKKADASGLAQSILSNPDYRGRMVLISWEHHVIPAIAQAFGLSRPPDWADDVFDRAWILNFDGGKPVSLQNVPQRLLPGDSPN
jgi:hypothetical protein